MRGYDLFVRHHDLYRFIRKTRPRRRRGLEGKNRYNCRRADAKGREQGVRSRPISGTIAMKADLPDDPGKQKISPVSPRQVQTFPKNRGWSAASGKRFIRGKCSASRRSNFPFPLLNAAYSAAAAATPKTKTQIVINTTAMMFSTRPAIA